MGLNILLAKISVEATGFITGAIYGSYVTNEALRNSNSYSAIW